MDEQSRSADRTGENKGRGPFTRRLARAAMRRPWLTVAAWVLMVAVALVLYAVFSSSFLAQDDFTTTPESKLAAQLIEERLPDARHDTEVMIVRSPELTTDMPVFQDMVNTLQRHLLSLGPEAVVGVLTPWDAPEEAGDLLVSADGHSALLVVTLAGDQDDAYERVTGVLRLADETDGRGGFEVVVTGGATWGHEAAELSSSDLRRLEIIGVPAALVILLVVFSTVVASTVPMIMAGVTIATASAAAAALGLGLPITVVSLNIAASMGLAVGVDYSLFTISRFREERRRGYPVPEAVERTAATANRAVFFSGMTVMLSLLGMLLVPYSAFTSLGVGAVLAVVFAVAAALTLLPALLRMLGDRVDALRMPWVRRRTTAPTPNEEAAADAGEHRSWWGRAAAIIMRRPTLSLCAGAALLLALAAPTFLMHRGVSGVAALPDRLDTTRGFEILSRDFSAGWTAPVQVVIDGPVLNPLVLGSLNRFRAELAADGRFQPFSLRTSSSGTLTVVGLLQNRPPTSDAALDDVRNLRERLIPAAFGGSPATVYVGGITANWVDGLGIITLYQPIVIAMVLTLSFILLLVAFRSLLVAATCIVMNLLSVGAAYGAVVLVFQYGVGAHPLGLRQVERVETYVPLVMFCLLFGLSMDYQVFLLSRIREHYEHTGDNREAVAFGVESTAGIITGAALIMVAVFAGLASGELVMFQQIGFGLGVAVLVDATVVRTVVAPATIARIGDRYWWLPRWLEWLPRVALGEIDSASHTAAPAGPTASRVDYGQADETTAGHGSPVVSDPRPPTRRGGGPYD